MQTVQIPLFPIEIFLLPGETTHLHIYEPRYQQLLSDCAKTNTGFGIPFKSNDKIEGIGSFVKIINAGKINPDGTSDIEIFCEDIFNLKKLHSQPENKLYPIGDVEFIDSVLHEGISVGLMQTLTSFLKKNEKVVIPDTPNFHLSAFEVAGLLEFSNADKIRLARTNSSVSREKILSNRIRILEKIREQVKILKDNFFLN